MYTSAIFTKSLSYPYVEKSNQFKLAKSDSWNFTSQYFERNWIALSAQAHAYLVYSLDLVRNEFAGHKSNLTETIPRNIFYLYKKCILHMNISVSLLRTLFHTFYPITFLFNVTQEHFSRRNHRRIYYISCKKHESPPLHGRWSDQISKQKMFSHSISFTVQL